MRHLLPSYDHPVTRIFLIGVMIESHAMTPKLERDLDALVEMFPHSLHIRTLQAHYAYSIRGTLPKHLRYQSCALTIEQITIYHCRCLPL